ncbi:MAG: hypothetical protein ACRCST_14305 [Turicibacter sp.]
MDIISELTYNPQIQAIIPILLIIASMLRTIPKLPKWSIQWLILIFALSFIFLQSGINAHTIFNGFIASMITTYITRGFVSCIEEKELSQLRKQISNLTEQSSFTNKQEENKKG